MTTYQGIWSESVGQHHPLPVLIEFIVVLIRAAGVRPKTDPIPGGPRPALRHHVTISHRDFVAIISQRKAVETPKIKGNWKGTLLSSLLSDGIDNALSRGAQPLTLAPSHLL